MSRPIAAAVRPALRLSRRGIPSSARIDALGSTSLSLAPLRRPAARNAYRTYATASTAPPRSAPSSGDHPPPPPPSSSSSSSSPSRSLPLAALVGALSGLAVLLGSRALSPSLTLTDSSSTALTDSTTAIAHQTTHQPSYGTPADYLACIAHLKTSWGAKGRTDRISTDEDDLHTHGFSEWSYHGAGNPTVVVWAETTEEVQEIILAAKRWKVPVTPYAGGTSLEGHFSSPYGGISLDLSNMDKILRVSEADGDISVQAGVKWEDINAHLKNNGIPLFFPIDPGPGATIGGMVATGCSGTNAVRYGTAKAEWFLNLTVVLPSGEIIKTRQRARKSSAGFDTTKLFIGAEGTLGVVTEATLRLAPLLPYKVAVVNFPGVEEAVSAATEVVNAGYPVQCVEFLDGRTMQAVNKAGQAGRSFGERDSLFFKFQGSDSAMAEVSKNVQAITKRHGGKDFEFAKSDQEAALLWEGRKAALWSVMALKEGCRVWTTDVCVPISKLPRLIRETSEDFARRGIDAAHLGHVGDGNVHTLALFSNDEELARVREAVHDMVLRALALEGTCTGEHGVGLGKVEYLETELGSGTVNLMETIKRTMDPLGLMNPGKLYPHIQPQGRDTAGAHAHA